MQELVQFLVDNWQWLISCFAAVVIFFIQLFKKRPIAKSLVQYQEAIATYEIPSLIRKAELTNLNGQAKKEYVMQRAINLLKSMIKLSDLDIEDAASYFSVCIENFLNTPQKKG